MLALFQLLHGVAGTSSPASAWGLAESPRRTKSAPAAPGRRPTRRPGCCRGPEGRALDQYALNWAWPGWQPARPGPARPGPGQPGSARPSAGPQDADHGSRGPCRRLLVPGPARPVQRAQCVPTSARLRSSPSRACSPLVGRAAPGPRPGAALVRPGARP